MSNTELFLQHNGFWTVKLIEHGERKIDNVVSVKKDNGEKSNFVVNLGFSLFITSEQLRIEKNGENASTFLKCSTKFYFSDNGDMLINLKNCDNSDFDGIYEAHFRYIEGGNDYMYLNNNGTKIHCERRNFKSIPI